MLLNVLQGTGQPLRQGTIRSSVLMLRLRNAGSDKTTCHGFMFYKFGISKRWQHCFKTRVESGEPRGGSTTLFSRPARLLQPPKSVQFLKARDVAVQALLSSRFFFRLPSAPASSLELACVCGPLSSFQAQILAIVHVTLK